MIVFFLQLFPNGDQTTIGNHGATLSGGQKSRISLARALYQDFDVYLIDEPFASVDIKVANEMYEKCFQKMLLNNKCIILATNHLNYLKSADLILSLDYGSISCSMTTSELPTNLEDSQTTSLPKDKMADHNLGQLEIPEEEREFGVVKLDVYVSYIESIGYFVFGLIIVSICLVTKTIITSKHIQS